MVALSISSHKQTQLNRVGCFLILYVLSNSDGSVFPDYLEVATAVVVYVWSWSNFSPCINIVLIFFSYSGPSGILGLDGYLYFGRISFSRSF